MRDVTARRLTRAGAWLAAAALAAPVGVAVADDHQDPQDDGVPARVLERNDEVLAQDAQRRETAEVTADMLLDAVLRLDATVRSIDPAGAVRELETEREEDGGTVVTLTADLLFEFGSDEISAEARAAIVERARQIPDGAPVSVDGHTDSIGDDALNDDLSRRRAAAVAAVLAEERPDLDLAVTGHGSRQPVAENTVDGEDNPGGRALNRRVEISYESS